MAYFEVLYCRRSPCLMVQPSNLGQIVKTSVNVYSIIWKPGRFCCHIRSKLTPQNSIVFFLLLLLFSCSFFLLLRFAYHGLVWVTIFEFWRWLSLDGCKFFSSTSVLFVCLFVCLFVFRVFSPYITFPFSLSLFLKEKERKKDVWWKRRFFGVKRT